MINKILFLMNLDKEAINRFIKNASLIYDIRLRQIGMYIGVILFFMIIILLRGSLLGKVMSFFVLIGMLTIFFRRIK